MTSSNRKLQHARLRYHWSQEELARRLQTTQQSIARWENGKVRPSPFYRQKLCEIFEASEETLGFVDMQEKRLSSVSNDKLQAVIDPLLPLPLGPALVGRDALLATLKVRLFSTQGVPMAIIHGIPGVGKTTVAAALAHDEEVRAYFTGGILWVGLGPKPHILAHLSRWGVLLGVRGDTRSTLEEWSIALRMAIGPRKMLVVIDDAWEIESALACKVGGAGCAFVLTTRFPSIASYFTPTNVTTLHELNNENSLQLLSYLAPGIIQHDPEAVHSLVRTVGGLPIGLILLGSYLNRYAYDRQSRRINTALQHLQDASVLLGLTMVQAPDVQTTFSLDDLIKLSETTLSEEERCAFHALAVFPAKPNSFSEEAALVVTNAQVDVLDKLSDAGLIETPGEARYTLHQTIRMYATTHRNSGWDIEERFTSYYARFVQDHKMNYLALEPESVNISTAFEVASQQEFLFAQVDFIQSIDKKRKAE